jgi:hypothetical protein
MELQGWMVRLAWRVLLASMEPLAWMELRVSKELLASMARPVFKVPQDCSDL